jgi:hypothetical protein
LGLGTNNFERIILKELLDAYVLFSLSLSLSVVPLKAVTKTIKLLGTKY